MLVLVALALAVLAVLTRLPQFLGPYLALDGDDAVVGLMAEHLRNGGEFSLFFWGQRYGIAAPEAALIAAFFAGFGTS
ncbi:MAG: hypothetical protein KC591_12760, partial [Gemmatimonadetes bacterium]|nr:hypothetical protein [Gemmatimonadota bacterium]